MQNIEFNTSGWQDTIADGFTALNTQRVANAIASHVLESKEYGFNGAEYRQYIASIKNPPRKPIVIVGYDTRYLSEYFARHIAGVLASHNITVKLADSETPLPVVAKAVIDNCAVGGAVITADEQPATVNGLKWISFWGSSATPEILFDIGNRISSSASNNPKNNSWDIESLPPLVEFVDLRSKYLKDVSSLIDEKTLKKSTLKIGLDSLHSSARTYLKPYLEKLGFKVTEINGERDVFFGEDIPSVDANGLSELSKLVKKNKLNIGLACSGDRFGIVDSNGTWVSPNTIFGLILEHLVINKGMKGRVCRNVFTSNFVDTVAKSHGLEIREAPVGSGHIGMLMKAGQYIMGCEEYGGLSLINHIPESDGMAACLLVLEKIVQERKPLEKIIERLHKQYGEFKHTKLSVPAHEVRLVDIMERLKNKPPLDLGGFSVWRIDQIDGFKFILKDGSWLGITVSEPESVVLIYAESGDAKKLNTLMSAGKNILKGKF
jgi:phosphomannomutase